MAMEPGPTVAEIQAAQEADRIRLQGALGQLHGVLHDAIVPIEDGPNVAGSTGWFPPDSYAEIRAAYDELGPAFGVLHAELNSGAHDAKLQSIGLAGVQAAPKFEHLRRAVGKLGRGFALKPFKSALRWGGTIVGSLTREIPGGEVVSEFVQVAQNAVEEWDEAGDRSPASSSPAKRQQEGSRRS